MVVPTPVVELNESNSVLHESAGHDAIIGKSWVVPFIESPGICGGFGFGDEARTGSV